MELLAPAGNLMKFRTAIRFGADAVYVGGPGYSLRARADNFTWEQLHIAAKEAKDCGKRLYIAVNSYIPQTSWCDFTVYLEKLADLSVDGLIMSDPGAIRYLKKNRPEQSIHLSTQANCVNAETVQFWQEAGVDRVVLARELSLDDIKSVKKSVPSMELEAFAHGAMCVAYSGRCLLSNYMTHQGWQIDKKSEFGHSRSANLGDCSHTCRWQYSLVEEKRGGVELLAEEVAGGSMLFSSKDLCMVNYIREMMDAGITSLKIEGRMKSLLYTAVTVRVYRDALDLALKGETPGESKMKIWQRELDSVSRRDYSTGFYYGDNRALTHSGFKSRPDILYAGEIQQKVSDGYLCLAANKISRDSVLEVIGPGMKQQFIEDFELLHPDGSELDFVRHGTVFLLKTAAVFEKGDLIRIHMSKY